MFWKEAPVDQWAAELKEIDAEISDLRNRQTVLINNLNKHSVAQSHGHRSMVDWVASTLDMARSTASSLVYSAGVFGKHRRIEHRFVEGEISFDRAVATLHLAETRPDPDLVDSSYRMDLNRVARLISQQRRLARNDERPVFTERYCLAQPRLDESSWRIAGQLPGLDGRIFAKGLQERADEFRNLPGGEASTLAQRQADALVAMAQDSLDRNGGEISESSGSAVAIFVDLDRANDSGGELGAEVEYGPRVGPNTLDELLCTGSVQVIGLAAGRPIVTSDAAKAIPPAVRRTVAWRDGGCTIDACTSRYRLQPHHIRERRHGGNHDPDNLATLCWYHHHVAVHGQGFRIDPDSPPQRRRLIRTRAGPDPP